VAGILDLFKRRSRSVKNRVSYPLNSSETLTMLGATVSSGVNVNPASTMGISAVYACVRILAEGIASLPLKVYQKTPQGRVEASVVAAYQLFRTSPNEVQTAFEFLEMMQGMAGLRGNALAFINRNSFFEPASLIPIQFGDWSVYKTQDGLPVYTVRGKQYPHTAVLHVRGMSNDGVLGMSPIAVLAETMGLALAGRGHASNFFRNGTTPSGVLESPVELTKEQVDVLRGEIEKYYAGSHNTGRPMVLYGGMKWAGMSLNARDAQLLESRKFDVEEIARAFRVPLHLLQSTEKSTTWGSGIEQMNIGFIEYTLRPWLVRWEQALNKSLLTTEQIDQGYYFEFNLDALLRGDFKTRMDGYKIAIESGIVTINEVRAKENLPALPPDIGDVTYRPLNTARADQLETSQ
jgi:HK97 family phage portal protein